MARVWYIFPKERSLGKVMYEITTNSTMLWYCQESKLVFPWQSHNYKQTDFYLYWAAFSKMSELCLSFCLCLHPNLIRKI